MDWTQIIIAAIAAIAPILTVILTNRKTNEKIDKATNETEKSDKRTQIMLLMLEDRDLVARDELPENRKDIDDLYDEYTKLGGNSHIKRKYKEYTEWLDSLEVKKEE